MVHPEPVPPRKVLRERQGALQIPPFGRDDKGRGWLRLERLAGRGEIAGAYTNHQSAVGVIAATARLRGLVVATRNVHDFEMFPVKTFHSLHE
jgi:predicted nucleic acid-binding protein